MEPASDREGETFCEFKQINTSNRSMMQHHQRQVTHTRTCISHHHRHLLYTMFMSSVSEIETEDTSACLTVKEESVDGGQFPRSAFIYKFN